MKTFTFTVLAVAFSYTYALLVACIFTCDGPLPIPRKDFTNDRGKRAAAAPVGLFGREDLNVHVCQSNVP